MPGQGDGRIVERTCVRCRRKAPKASLLRLVLKDGRIVWDPAQRAPGRGAYLHPACVEQRVSGRSLARALRLSGDRTVELPPRP